MRRAAWILAAVPLLLAACHPLPQPGEPRLHGIQVEVTGRVGAPPIHFKGELLAVSSDTLWGLASDSVHARGFPLDQIEVRPDQGARLRPHQWALWAGLASGVGLAVACASYDASGGCILILPAVMLSYFMVSGLARLFTILDRPDPLPPDPAGLRRFSRFPAGLPPRFPRS